MKYEYHGQIICRTPHRSSKNGGEEQTVILNDEYEVQFLKTLGVANFGIWCSLSEKQKESYKNFENTVEQVYSICFELFTQYHTDLEFYALMYRNIPLYHFALDAYSMMFFASKKNEIIGYHTRIMKDHSEKAQIVRLYYDNKVLFPKSCKMHLGINLLDATVNDHTFTEEVIRKFYSNHIPELKCVDSLSSNECKAILKAKQQIQNDYEYVSDKEPWMYDYIQYKVQPDFRYMPLEGILQYKDIIADFLFERGFMSFDKDINDIKQYEEKKIQLIREEYRLFIEKASAFTGNKSAGLTALKWSSLSEAKVVVEYQKQSIQQEPKKNIVISVSDYDPLYGNKKKRIEKYENWIFNYEYYPENRLNLCLEPDLPFVGLERWRIKSLWDLTLQDRQERAEYEKKVDEAYARHKATLQVLRRQLRQEEEQESKRVQNIVTLKKEFQVLAERIDKAKDEVSQFAESTKSFKIIRNNNVAINTCLNRSYEKQYDQLWLRKKDFIRDLEANCAYVDCFISFIRKQDLMLKAIERRKTTDKWHIMGYSRRLIFTNWYAPIKEEKERLVKIEQIRREEALKREQERLRREFEQRKREEEARQAQFRYNQRNKHHRDDFLSFDKESHTYMVKGKVLDSVTTLVSNSFPKFKVEEHAKHTAARKGMTILEVIEMWEKKGEESRKLGTLLHEKIEKHYQGIDSPDDPTFQLFKQFTSKILLKPYRTEWGVYDYDLGIAGSIDFVDYQNGEYSIYDWKRSDKLIANELPAKINQYGEKGNYPLGHLDNSPYYHYALQLSIYKYILERNYGIKVSHLRLGIFHPSYAKPYLLEMPYLEDEVHSIFNLRSEIIL